MDKMVAQKEDLFKVAAPALSGSSLDPSLAPSLAWENYKARGAITPKVESWRYAPLARLSKFNFAADLKDQAKLVATINGKVSQALQVVENKIDKNSKPENHSRVVWLAQALAWQTHELTLAENPENMVVISSQAKATGQALQPGETQLAAAHLKIRLSKGVKATVLIDNAGDANSLSLISAEIADNASLTLVRRVENCSYGEEGDKAGNQIGHKISATDVSLQEGSHFHGFDVFTGGGQGYLRSEMRAYLLKKGADFHYDQIAVARDSSVIDAGCLIEHLHGDTTSRQDLRAVTHDQGRIAAAGTIHIAEGCPDSLGYQLLRGMLMSNDSKIDFKPALRIFTDTVKCSHGATVSRPDPQSLFYAQQRGMSRELATKILVQAFLDERLESLSQTKDQAQQKATLDAVAAWLAAPSIAGK